MNHIPWFESCACWTKPSDCLIRECPKILWNLARNPSLPGALFSLKLSVKQFWDLPSIDTLLSHIFFHPSDNIEMSGLSKNCALSWQSVFSCFELYTNSYSKFFSAFKISYGSVVITPLRFNFLMFYECDLKTYLVFLFSMFVPPCPRSDDYLLYFLFFLRVQICNGIL